MSKRSAPGHFVHRVAGDHLQLVLTMVDYLLSHPTTTIISSAPVISLPTLWSVLMDGLSSIWPATRTQVNGVSLGDAWPCSSMPSSPPAQLWENIVPFHKLTQWLCYSLMVPMSKLLNFRFLGSEMMTGLPEYRNGGLLVDTGLLTLKEKDFEEGIAAYKRNSDYKGAEVVPLFEPADDVIVEWRAATVGFLDELLVEVNKGLGLTGKEGLSLAQMLEAGTWKVSPPPPQLLSRLCALAHRSSIAEGCGSILGTGTDECRGNTSGHFVRRHTVLSVNMR